MSTRYTCLCPNFAVLLRRFQVLRFDEIMEKATKSLYDMLLYVLPFLFIHTLPRASCMRPSCLPKTSSNQGIMFLGRLPKHILFVSRRHMSEWKEKSDAWSGRG
jgi:hypothetical protein